MASHSVTASVLTQVHTLDQIQRPLPAPGPGEIQVRVKAVGLCGSDLHYYHQLRNGDAVVREPMTLGHEAAGIVEAVGPVVAGAAVDPDHVFQVGDRVALELGTPCGTCRYCRRPDGRGYHLCPQMQFAASARKLPHCQGALQERINRPARWCFRIPDTFSYDLGALIEPLAVAVHAHRRGGLADMDVDQAQSILVLGAGPVGLLVAAVCRYAHLQRGGRDTAARLHIVMLDLIQDRVDFAVQHGFADVGVVLPRDLLGKTDGDKDDETARLPPKFTNPKALSELLVSKSRDGALFDVTFECTGQESSVQAGIFSTLPGGRIVIVGMGASAQLIPLGTAAAKEVDIVGVFRYANDYPEAIRLLREADAEQLAHMEKIVSHSFPGLDNVAAAFERASKPYDEDGKLVLKVMIEP